MNKIYLKRLKRKIKLKGRIKCHGTKTNCKLEHLKEKPVLKQEKVVIKKDKWYDIFIKWWKYLLSKIK